MVESVAESERDRSTTGIAFNFGLCDSQIDYISDRIDALTTVAERIERSFLDPTPHFTTDVIEIDDIQENLDAKTRFLGHLGK